MLKKIKSTSTLLRNGDTKRTNLAVTIRLFEEITASPDILKGRINNMKAHSRDTGAEMLSLIMNDQVHEVVFCE